MQSINDRVKLAEAHDTCYKLGFDKGPRSLASSCGVAPGIMSLGPFKGQPVKRGAPPLVTNEAPRKAKFEFRTVMIQAKQAFTYSEPEKKAPSFGGALNMLSGGVALGRRVCGGIHRPVWERVQVRAWLRWYLKYGEESWKAQIEAGCHRIHWTTGFWGQGHLQSSNFVSRELENHLSSWSEATTTGSRSPLKTPSVG